METFGTQPATACNNGGRLLHQAPSVVASENEQRPSKEAATEECPLYSANITAACHAASTASSRLYCTSKQEKLERRRLSNRRSALRKRVQEQAEIESLEEQIRFLAQANTCLKAEELRLEQLLRHAQNCIRGKEHFHNIENGPDSKPSFLVPSTPSINLPVATPAFSQTQLPPTSFPASRASAARRAALARATPGTATPVGVNQWGHFGKSENLGLQSDPVASSAGTSGEDMFAALSKFVDQSESKMYGLVTPMAAGDGVSLPVQAKDKKLPPPQGLDAVWNILLARAAQDEGLLHFFHNKAAAACLSQGSAGPSSTPDAQNISSVAAKQEKPSLIVSQQQRPSDSTAPFGYGSSYSHNSIGFQIGKSEKIDEQHARPEEDPAKLAEYFFQFDQKMEPAPSTFDCAFSDVSSSCSADLDRFLALDEQLE